MQLAGDTLRLEAREHPAQAAQQEQHQDHRLWLQLLQGRAHIHVYTGDARVRKLVIVRMP